MRVLTNWQDAPRTGYILEKGTSLVLENLNDTNAVWINGTSGDIYSAAGS